MIDSSVHSCCLSLSGKLENKFGYNHFSKIGKNTNNPQLHFKVWNILVEANLEAVYMEFHCAPKWNIFISVFVEHFHIVYMVRPKWKFMSGQFSCRSVWPKWNFISVRFFHVNGGGMKSLCFNIFANVIVFNMIWL